MNVNTIHQTARERLNLRNPYRLSLIYAAVALGLSTLVTVINFILSRQLESATGLAGIGTRSILGTVQTTLSLALMILLPFWDAGYRHTCLCQARGSYTDFSNLLEGLRRWGPVLRLSLLRLVLMMLCGFVCMQAAGMLFMFTPFSMEAMETLSQISEPTDTAAVEAMVETMWPLMIPMYVIFGVVFVAVITPVLYRIRLADLMVLDGENRGLTALKNSNQAMRGHCLQYFLLDLKYWWFYLGQLLITALAYGDAVLPALGVNADPDVLYFGFFAASVALQFLLTWRCAPLVYTAHGLAYEALKPEEEQLKIEN